MVKPDKKPKPAKRYWTRGLMQSATDAPRQALTLATVTALIQSESLSVAAGLELLDADGSLDVDISDRLVSGSVSHNNYANIHGTCQLRIAEGVEWGSSRLRPYVTFTDGATEARFNLGVYIPETPARVLGTSPEEFEVEGYDLLAVLSCSSGVSHAEAAAVNVVNACQAILTAHGAGTPHLIVESSAVTAAAKVWALDENTTWLGIVNDLLGSIGYRGLWVDWNGRYRSEPYQAPSDRGSEWTYDADDADTIVGEDRTVIADYFDAPNRWVFVRNNPAVGLADGATEDGSTGVYVVENQSDGPTSIDARGRTIPSVRQLDAVDQASLVAQGDEIVDREKRLDTTVEVTVGPNPLHWHADVVTYADAAMGPPIKAAVHEWSWSFDADMRLTLRKVGS